MNKHLFGYRIDLSYATDPENAVGQLMYTNQHIYRFVQNNDAAVDFVFGEVAFHKFSDAATMEQKVYQALTANLGIMAGVVQATGGLAHTKYGFVKCFGYEGSVSVSGATTGGTNIAIGDYLKGVNTQNYLVRDGATQPLYDRNVQILTTVTTTTTPAAALVPGFINCLG